MKLNRIELKKLIYDFNSMSNRLLQANFHDYNDVLSKFVGHIRACELIMDYVNDCGESDQDIAKEVNEVASTYGEFIFTLGDSESEEIRNVFGILSYIVENKIPVHFGIGMAYSHSDSYQDMIKAFNARVVMVLIRHIERYLTKIGIDMGLDEKKEYIITVTNGQVNIANDNATINASVNNGIDLTKLSSLLQVIRHEAKTLEDADKDNVYCSLDVVEQELQSDNPRKSFVQTALNAIQAVKGTAELAVSVAALVQFLQQIF